MKNKKRIKLAIFSTLLLINIIPSFFVPSAVSMQNQITTVKAADKIKLNKKKITLKKKQTIQLKVMGTNAKVKWSSSNKKIASVSSKGKVTAKKKGSATITAKVKKKKYSCKVKVTDKKESVARISLDKTSAHLKKGESIRLKASVFPSDAASKSLQWSSGNPKIASVKNGKVKAKSRGETVISVKTKNGKKAFCTITVSDYSYELKLMNNPQYKLYGGLNKDGDKIGNDILLYVKTDDPDKDNLVIRCNGKNLMFGMIKYDDILYKETEYLSALMPVKNGYVSDVKPGMYGSVTFTLYEKINAWHEWELVTLTVTIHNYTAAEDNWYKTILAQKTNTSMSDYEKMTALCNYVRSDFKYSPNDGTNYLILASHIGVYWEKKEIDCLTATYIMKRFADMLGLKNQSTYAGYLNHYYATVDIEGKSYIFDATPDSSKNVITNWDYIEFN